MKRRMPEFCLHIGVCMLTSIHSLLFMIILFYFFEFSCRHHYYGLILEYVLMEFHAIIAIVHPLLAVYDNYIIFFWI